MLAVIGSDLNYFHRRGRTYVLPALSPLISLVNIGYNYANAAEALIFLIETLLMIFEPKLSYRFFQ